MYIHNGCGCKATNSKLQNTSKGRRQHVFTQVYQSLLSQTSAKLVILVYSVPRVFDQIKLLHCWTTCDVDHAKISASNIAVNTVDLHTHT